jgi:long-chain acyl-CoA synthetase
MYHIFCLTATLIVHEVGRPDGADHQSARPAGLVKELGSWKFTGLTGVNTLFNGLLNTPGFDRLDFSSLKVVVGGGAAIRSRWPNAGRR